MYVRRCRSHSILFIYSVCEEGWCDPTPSIVDTLNAYMLYRVAGGWQFLGHQARAVSVFVRDEDLTPIPITNMTLDFAKNSQA